MPGRSLYAIVTAPLIMRHYILARRPQHCTTTPIHQEPSFSSLPTFPSHAYPALLAHITKPKLCPTHAESTTALSLTHVDYSSYSKQQVKRQTQQSPLHCKSSRLTLTLHRRAAYMVRTLPSGRPHGVRLFTKKVQSRNLHPSHTAGKLAPVHDSVSTDAAHSGISTPAT